MILPYALRLVCLCLASFFLVHAALTLIASCLAPAVLRLAGKWNWWPGERGNVLRRDQGVRLRPKYLRHAADRGRDDRHASGRRFQDHIGQRLGA